VRDFNFLKIYLFVFHNIDTFYLLQSYSHSSESLHDHILKRLGCVLWERTTPCHLFFVGSLPSSIQSTTGSLLFLHICFFHLSFYHISFIGRNSCIPQYRSGGLWKFQKCAHRIMDIMIFFYKKKSFPPISPTSVCIYVYMTVQIDLTRTHPDRPYDSGTPSHMNTGPLVIETSSIPHPSLTESTVRLLYLRVYDSHLSSDSSCKLTPSPPLSYSLMSVHTWTQVHWLS
jgi:hypothetical protein